MSDAPCSIVKLDTEKHCRHTFDSGSESLDRYFRQHVTQDVRRRVTTCYVALTDEQRVVGYYTVAAASVPLSDLPDELRKKLPRYPAVPAVLLGRLAVDRAFQGKGIGGGAPGGRVGSRRPFGYLRPCFDRGCQGRNGGDILPTLQFPAVSQPTPEALPAAGNRAVFPSSLAAISHEREGLRGKSVRRVFYEAFLSRGGPWEGGTSKISARFALMRAL